MPYLEYLEAAMKDAEFETMEDGKINTFDDEEVKEQAHDLTDEAASVAIVEAVKAHNLAKKAADKEAGKVFLDVSGKTLDLEAASIAYLDAFNDAYVKEIEKEMEGARRAQRPADPASNGNRRGTGRHTVRNRSKTLPTAVGQ